MPIELNCYSCGQLLRVPDEAAGGQARCPKCEAVLLVPADAVPKKQISPSFGESESPGAPQVNPYESPISDMTPPVGVAGNYTKGRSAVVPTAVEAGDIFQTAFQVWQNNLGLVVGVGAVVLTINVAFGLTSGALQESAEAPLVILGFVLNITGNLLGMFLGIGQAQISLKLARRQTAAFGDLFGGGPLFGPVFLTSLLAGIALMLGFLFLIIPGLILCVLFWPYYWLIVDEQESMMESFSVAMEIGKLNVGATILCWLGTVGIALLGCLTCGVGFILLQPLFMMVFTVAYLKMAGQIK